MDVVEGDLNLAINKLTKFQNLNGFNPTLTSLYHKMIAGENTVSSQLQSAKSERKRLACSNCRRRRKKCDLDFPCSSCERLKLECNVNEEDLRKKRYSTGYVRNLENHIRHLETSLSEIIKNISSNEECICKKVITSIIPDTHYNLDSSIAQNNLQKSNPLLHQCILQNKSNTNLKQVNTQSDESHNSNSSLDLGIVHTKKFFKGSIYPEGPVNYKPKKNEDKNSNTQRRISDLKTTVIHRSPGKINGSLNTDPAILKSLSNFYKWLYPGHFIFVHRESFLYGFFNDSDDNYENSEYCSQELIYAMAAIGSRLTPNLHTHSIKYYQKAKTKLLKIIFDENSISNITTVQALLCLAFFELGNGNNKLSWYFSGLAIRIGYDMGFHLDPKVWVTEDSSAAKLSDSELEIKSRIYWGCYIADHFICLLLGRASTLNVSNSTVPESDELPEINGTEDFRFENKCILQISLPLKNLVILSRIIQIFTSKIFIEPSSIIQRVKYLTNFNLKVYNWRKSLPDFLKWSQNLITDIEISTDPTISYLWYHYYIVLLIFNKPFMDDSPEPRLVVLEVLRDLKTLFSNFKLKFTSYKKAALYQLYTCLLSISCIKKLTSMLPDIHITSFFPDLEHEMQFFQHVFKELYPSYELPKRMEEDTEFELEREMQTFNQVNSLNYTYDFSLSDEIDDLIKQVFGFDGCDMNLHHSV